MVILFRTTDDGAIDHPLYGRYATITQGVPGRCPHCDAFGRIVHADLSRHLQSQRCLDCTSMWQYEFDTDGRIREVRVLTESHAPSDGAHDDDGVVDLRDGADSDSSVEPHHLGFHRLLHRS